MTAKAAVRKCTRAGCIALSRRRLTRVRRAVDFLHIHDQRHDRQGGRALVRRVRRWGGSRTSGRRAVEPVPLSHQLLLHLLHDGDGDGAEADGKGLGRRTRIPAFSVRVRPFVEYHGGWFRDPSLSFSKCKKVAENSEKRERSINTERVKYP